MLTEIDEASQFLLQYSPAKQGGETYALGRMERLMERLGNPQDSLQIIHVAGTSGKTSTAYFIRSLLQTHGAKTGLTASPHITSITERVQIDGTPLRDGRFLQYLNEFLHIIGAWPDIQPTYFELLTAFAYWVFHQEKVDYAVVEVGLGGLLDATNVINNPKVCVITPIGLDHTQILGTTIAAIAQQKAGIITEKAHVFSAEQIPEAHQVIKTACARTNSDATFVTPLVDESSSAPLFQQSNFSLAKAVVSFIASRDKLPTVSSAAIEACITKIPPGRFESYNVGGITIILDGAHNPQKLAAFVRSLRLRHKEPVSWLVGFISAPDTKIEACVKEIVASNDEYTITEFTVGQDIKGRHSVAAGSVQQHMNHHGIAANINANPRAAFDTLLQSKQRTIVVSGSLYLVAQLRNYVIERATSPQV